MAMCFVGDRMFMATSRARIRDAVTKLMGARIAALEGRPEYVETLRRMGASKTSTIFYADVQRIAGHVGKILAREVDAETVQEINAIMQLTGFADIERVAVADIPQGTNWRSEFFIKLKKRTGLFGWMQDAPTSHRFAAYTPKNPLLYGAERADMGRYLENYLRFLVAIEETTAEEIDEIFARYDKVLGIDVRKEFIGAFGDEWAAYLAAPEHGGLIPDFVVFASVKDRMALQKSMRRDGGEVRRRDRHVRRGQDAPRHAHPPPQEHGRRPRDPHHRVDRSARGSAAVRAQLDDGERLHHLRALAAYAAQCTGAYPEPARERRVQPSGQVGPAGRGVGKLHRLSRHRRLRLQHGGADPAERAGRDQQRAQALRREAQLPRAAQRRRAHEAPVALHDLHEGRRGCGPHGLRLSLRPLRQRRDGDRHRRHGRPRCRARRARRRRGRS